MKPLTWWGYVHAESGDRIVKRFFGETDLYEARGSNFCKDVYGPFGADDVLEANLVYKDFVNREYMDAPRSRPSQKERIKLTFGR